MTPSLEQIRSIVEEAIELGQNGKIRACKNALKFIYQHTKKNPFLLWDNEFVSRLGKTILMMIHWDLIDEEDKSIGLAHLAYLYITKGIEKEENMQPEPDTLHLFRLRKDRVILLKSFDDYFVDSLQEFYFADNKAQNMDIYNEQRKAVLSRLPYMQFADIYMIEQDYPNLGDDEFLLELANHIEHDTEFSNENLKEGMLLHKILYKYSFQKLKEGKLVY